MQPLLQRKSNYYILYVFGALGNQNAMRMRHIVICSLSGSTTFSHIMPYTARFLKKMLLSIKCVFSFSLQLLSETFLILRRPDRDMIANEYWSSRKVHVILVRL